MYPSSHTALCVCTTRLNATVERQEVKIEGMAQTNRDVSDRLVAAEFRVDVVVGRDALNKFYVSWRVRRCMYVLAALCIATRRVCVSHSQFFH